MKAIETWYSPRVERDVTVVRWGEIGTPLLIFPTAGGDAEEIERFLVIDTLAEFLAEGRIKVYSCDSVAGRAMLAKEGTVSYRTAVLDRFQQFIGEEMVPAIRADCQDPDIEVVAAGSSIGAFNALAAVCRYPHAFRSALCMSGTYDLSRFLDGVFDEHLYRSSPLHFMPNLEGPTLEALRTRFVLLASGEGAAEDIGESWRVANVLGAKGVPNRVDSWGPDWDHDWPLWRNMLHTYVGRMSPDGVGGD
jgi:esterase/lipase superfamily enzyme